MNHPQNGGGRPFAGEAKLDEIAGYVLLGGAIASFILVGAGLALLARQPAPPSVNGEPIASALRSAFGLQPAGIINLGVLVLLATPLLRVLTAIAEAFAVLRWWRFAAVSVAVLILLLISFFVAA